MSRSISVSRQTTGYRGAVEPQPSRRQSSEWCPMPAGQTGTPMTYLWQGRQFIVVAIGGGNYTAEFVAFALPAQPTATQ